MIVFIEIRGCEISYLKRELPSKNPTSYIFNTNLKDLRNLIQNSYYDFNKTLNGKAAGIFSLIKDSVYLKEFQLLFKDKNKFDLVYAYFSGPSNIFFSKEEKIIYSASFHFHLS